MLKGVQLGTIDLAFVTGAPLPNIIPDVGIFSILGCWKQISGRKRKLRLGARLTSPLPEPKRTSLPSVKTSANDPRKTLGGSAFSHPSERLCAPQRSLAVDIPRGWRLVECAIRIRNRSLEP
jgi:hypothetical protein